MRNSRAIRLWTIVALLVVATETPAAAYTDPGSGALLWQILAGGFVGGMFYFRKMLRWFKGRQQGRNASR